MAFAYLLDPQNQYMTKSGAINTAGILRVFDAATDDPAVTYKDFNGTLNEEAIVLDNNGRAVVIAESEKAYRVEVYDRYNSLMWTTTPLWCMAAGGGVDINMVDVISSDGSVFVDKAVVGSTTTFDLSVADGSTELLEWLKAEGYTSPSAGQFVPTYSSGTMQIGEYGVQLQADQYYHFTAHFRAEVFVPEDPIYDSVDIVFRTEDSTIYSKKVTVDCTTALPQEFEVSFDVMAGTDMEVGIFAENVDSNTISLGLLDMEVHRVFSGAPSIPGGVQRRLSPGANIVITDDNVITADNADWDAASGQNGYILNKPDLSIYATTEDVAENYQEKLTAGDNIVIEDNVISATVPEFAEADWDAASGEPGFIHNKPDLTIYATTEEVAEDYQEKLTAGSNITIENNVISATAEPQVNADWEATSGVAEILHKPDLSIYAQSADLATVATSGSYDDLTNKPSIPPGQVNSDWEATSGVAEILNKPTEKPLVAGANITIAEGADSVTISATSTAQVNADWLAVSGPAEILNKPQLATVATSGSYTDLTDTPAIPAAQVNSDWTATSGVQEILHKPDLSIYAQSADLATVATTGSYDDLLDKPAIPSAQVNADWDATSGVQEILHKPDLSIYAQSANLATVATTGSYTDLTDTPAIPPAQVNSDWDATSGISQILNKPEETTLTAGENITITESGSTITISAQGGGAAQVNADWDATSGVSEILNKPTLSTVATSGSYNDLTDKPTIRNVPAITSNDNGKVLKATYSAMRIGYGWETESTEIPTYTTSEDGKVLGVVDNSGTASLEWVTPAAGGVTDVEVNGSSVVSGGVASITVPAAQVQTDWDATSGIASIANKPTIPTVPTAGNMLSVTNGVLNVTTTAGITDVQQVNALPAQTVATVLYLIPET